jgi:photosystem II stability/assembly factor-like uncharacterized protein
MNPRKLTGSTAAVRRMCLVLALAGLIWPVAAIAQVKGSASFRDRGWRPVGPGPAPIEAAIAAHAPSRTIYIGSFGGVLKSTDGGVTFVPASNGIEGVGATSMAMAPNDPNIVYLGSNFGTLKTTDGAATWNLTNEFLPALSMAIDPTNPNIVYSGGNGFVEKTIDGGDTWDLAMKGMTSPTVFYITVDPNNPSVLYAGTAGEGGFKSVDGAASWTPLGIDTTVWQIIVDPTNSNVVYAGSNGNGVYKSTDAGATFARVGSPRVGVVLSLALSGGRLYAGTATEGVSVSEDGGATWRNTGAGDGLALGLSVDSSGAVYLATNFEGAFVLPAAGHPHRFKESASAGDARDNGWRRLAWKQLKDCNCESGHAIAIDPSDDRHVFLSTNDGGLLVTEDGGRSWQDGGRHGLSARSPRGIAFDPQEPRRVYAGSFTGSGFFKSEDHGRHWQRRLFGSGTVYVAGVTVDPVDHTIYVSNRSNDGIWKSTDFGETFTRIDRAPGAPADEYLGLNGRGIAVDPRNHTTVFHAGDFGVWRSQDAGASWVNVEAESNTQVTVDPTDSSIVYASGQSGVFKSTDGGDSFVLKFEELISKASSVQIHPRNHNVLYAGTGDGVFKSTDGGETWFSVGELFVNGLALDLDNPNILYASTEASVFKLVTAGQ